ncbi:MAG: Fe-Mn family superoxide dismutase, partial [Planctomycetaceae bacterium]
SHIATCSEIRDMDNLSRRGFLFASSGAAAGSFVASGLADDTTGSSHANTGLVTGKPKPLRFKSIPGFLSAEQIAPHHSAHYGGALRGYTAADTQLQSNIAAGTAIDPSAYGAIQRARTSKGNSVILHELYFDELTAKSNAPSPEVIAAIQKRFGSVTKWAGDFQASAKAATGWAMLVFHPVNGALYNVVSDEHAMGVLWMATPLVVIDVYEHAFYVDYQNRKTDYIAKFMDHIDWQEVNRRFKDAS